MKKEDFRKYKKKILHFFCINQFLFIVEYTLQKHRFQNFNTYTCIHVSHQVLLMPVTMGPTTPLTHLRLTPSYFISGGLSSSACRKCLGWHLPPILSVQVPVVVMMEPRGDPVTSTCFASVLKIKKYL